MSASAVGFAADIDSVESRTEAAAQATQALLDIGFIDHILEEPYPVKDSDAAILFTLDRALVPFFGFRSYGQHLNGYVRRDDGIWLWIARRAQDRRIFPGMLDNLVAGGLPHGLSLEQNLLKECYEEAGMPAGLARQARPVSAISYNGLSQKGYKPDTLYCYDIELTEDFVPVNTDGEVEYFELMPVERVINIVRHEQLFKPNCNLVLIDFFARHGLIDPQDPEFLPIQHALHVPFVYDGWHNVD